MLKRPQLASRRVNTNTCTRVKRDRRIAGADRFSVMTAIEHRHLRSALEFAVLIAAEGQKRRPPIAFPKELKPFLAAAATRRHRARSGAARRRGRPGVPVGDLRRCSARTGRRGRPAVARRDEGWETGGRQIIEQREAEAASSDLRRELKRAEKRRAAAEQAAARIQVELLHRDATIAEQASELDDLRAEVSKAGTRSTRCAPS